LLPTTTQNKPMLGVVEGDGDTRLESLNRNCCPELIATVPIDRIGITIRTLPDILPVNFALVGEKIVFRIIPGTKLDAAALARWWSSKSIATLQTARQVGAYLSGDHAQRSPTRLNWQPWRRFVCGPGHSMKVSRRG